MDDARKLTIGEKSLASSIFGQSIDLEAVEMRHRKWWPFQPRNVVMAPFGHLYFHPQGNLWREDFGSASVDMQAFFLHEMCHVWQSQSGLFLPLRRPPFARYSYSLVANKPFRSYGIEQQAEIVANSFLMRKQARMATAEEQRLHEMLVAQLQ